MILIIILLSFGRSCARAQRSFDAVVRDRRTDCSADYLVTLAGAEEA